MPRVDWPRSRRRQRALLVASAVAVVLMSLAGTLTFNVLNAPKAEAATQIPDPTSVTAGDPVSLVISQSSDANVINAPVTWAKFYFDASETGTEPVSIWNAPWSPCNNYPYHTMGSDWYGPDNNPSSAKGCISNGLDSRVYYEFYAVSDNQETIGPQLFTVNGQTGLDVNTGARRMNVNHNGWANINLPVGNTVSAISGFKVVYARAYWPGNLGVNWTTKVHSFRFGITNAQDDVGYWAQAGTSSGGVKPAVGQYAAHYVGTKLDYYVKNFGFNFAPPCGMLTPKVASLRWYDADASPGSPVSFDFYGTPPGGVRQHITYIDNNTNPINLGGNNVFREFVFTAQPGWKYQWVWHNIRGVFGSGGAANNLQYWLPFDSVFYDQTCFNYHSTVAIADGKRPNQVLDFSKAADQHVQFTLNAFNTQAAAGPVATTTPTISPGGWATLDGSVAPWNVNRVIPGFATLTTDSSGRRLQFAYQFDPLTPDGLYCFGDKIRPHTSPGDAGTASDNQICYTVKNDRRFPSKLGLDSDIHAGGGSCPAQNAGSINGGNPPGGGAASYGMYVVSAAPLGAVGGQINNFGSDNAPGRNQLNIGQNGGYKQVCQNDLYTYAMNNKDLAQANQHAITAPGDYPLDGMSGIYFATVPITIHGAVNNKVTIVMQSGDLSITGDIKMTTANSPDPRNPASLGIITNGPSQSVFVYPAVRRVDAYIFSDGTVDTCATDTVYAPPGCGNTLTLNGFIMAKSVNLKRLGPDNTLGPQIGETLRLTPQVYLSPPFFFDAGADNNQIQGDGERQPLF